MEKININTMDILEELNKERVENVDFQQNQLLKEAYSILKRDQESANNNFSVSGVEDSDTTTIIKSNKLNAKCIFSINDIKNVCIDNRLRFLNKKNYKSELPYDAYIKCSAFEIRVNRNVDFFILTEANNFKANFPNSQHLIFADIGNGEFYFIKKWGNLFPNYRKFISKPFKNLENFTISIFLFALVLAIFTPTNFLTNDIHVGYFSMIRIAYYFWCVVALTSLFTYYLVGIRKNLNSNEWDSTSFLR